MTAARLLELAGYGALIAFFLFVWPPGALLVVAAVCLLAAQVIPTHRRPKGDPRP